MLEGVKQTLEDHIHNPNLAPFTNSVIEFIDAINTEDPGRRSILTRGPLLTAGLALGLSPDTINLLQQNKAERPSNKQLAELVALVADKLGYFRKDIVFTSAETQKSVTLRAIATNPNVSRQGQTAPSGEIDTPTAIITQAVHTQAYEQLKAKVDAKTANPNEILLKRAMEFISYVPEKYEASLNPMVKGIDGVLKQEVSPAVHSQIVDVDPYTPGVQNPNYILGRPQVTLIFNEKDRNNNEPVDVRLLMRNSLNTLGFDTVLILSFDQNVQFVNKDGNPKDISQATDEELRGMLTGERYIRVPNNDAFEVLPLPLDVKQLEFKYDEQ